MVPPQKQALPSFDELVELAQHNPDAFTQLKKDICEELILSASFNMQDRLWAQQSHIDLVVSQCKNPIHANVTLMRELSQQMIKFQNALDGESEKEKVSAEIVPFTPRDNGWR